MNKNQSQSGSVHLIITVVLVAALLGTVGFIFWQNFANKKNIDLVSASDVTGDLYKVVAKYSSSSTSIKLDKDKSGDSAPFYTLSGKDYYILANKGSMITVSDSVAITDMTNKWSSLVKPIVSDVTNYFVTNKFKDISSKGIFGKYMYSSKSVVCNYDGDKSEPLYIACANIADYAPVAKLAEPFIQAYRTSSSGPGENAGYFGSPEISTSAASGYQTATMTVGGAMGIFYKKDGENWKYFKSAQQQPSALSCSFYDTTESKAAFKGEACTDGSASSTVQ